jgi:microsomal dipeptidase-like Zn-dependent dipeptidase
MKSLAATEGISCKYYKVYRECFSEPFPARSTVPWELEEGKKLGFEIELVAYVGKLSQLGDHVEHMVNVTGIHHVCIGSDSAGGTWPKGVQTAATFVNLTRELVQRGFSAAEVKQIWGGNFLRLLREILP